LIYTKTCVFDNKQERKPYIEKAAQLKAEYEKALEEDNSAEMPENEGEDANDDGEHNDGDANEEQNGDDVCKMLYKSFF
jgi:hypothetical protein